MLSMGKEDNKSKKIILEGQITKPVQASHGWESFIRLNLMLCNFFQCPI
jgi:hypothetical protein